LSKINFRYATLIKLVKLALQQQHPVSPVTLPAKLVMELQAVIAFPVVLHIFYFRGNALLVVHQGKYIYI